MSKATSQQSFWESEDGDAYIERNISASLHAANLKFFSEIFKSMGEVPQAVLELGANVGMNYRAISALNPSLDYTGVEVNKKAFEALRALGCESIHSSIEDFQTAKSFDFVFTKGVLIHLNPESLQSTYEKMVSSSRKWLLVAEYYSPRPEAIEYRGRKDLLFKRDFAGELLDRFPDLHLHSYGFAYHRGPFPQDDISWFVLKKTKS